MTLALAIVALVVAIAGWVEVIALRRELSRTFVRADLIRRRRL